MARVFMGSPVRWPKRCLGFFQVKRSTRTTRRGAQRIDAPEHPSVDSASVLVDAEADEVFVPRMRERAKGLMELEPEDGERREEHAEEPACRRRLPR